MTKINFLNFGILSRQKLRRMTFNSSLTVFLAACLFIFPGCGEKKQAEQQVPQVAVGETDVEKVPPVPESAVKKEEPAGDLTGTGSIKGSISYEGAVPEPEPFATGADPVCAGHQVFSEELMVNENKALQNVFIYIKDGLEGKSFPVPSTPVTLDQQGCQYKPHVFGFQVGQTLEIVNSDSTLHNVHGIPGQLKEFNLGMPLKGMKVKKTFEGEDIVRFKCDVHPWMSAYAGVLTHPYFAVTGENGSFEINNIPAGMYVLGVWHEKLGEQERRITVTNGSVETLDFTYSG